MDFIAFLPLTLIKLFMVSSFFLLALWIAQFWVLMTWVRAKDCTFLHSSPLSLEGPVLHKSWVPIQQISQTPKTHCGDWLLPRCAELSWSCLVLIYIYVLVKNRKMFFKAFFQIHDDTLLPHAVMSEYQSNKQQNIQQILIPKLIIHWHLRECWEWGADTGVLLSLPVCNLWCIIATQNFLCLLLKVITIIIMIIMDICFVFCFRDKKQSEQCFTIQLCNFLENNVII